MLPIGGVERPRVTRNAGASRGWPELAVTRNAPPAERCLAGVLRDPFGASNSPLLAKVAHPPPQEGSHRRGVDSQNESEKNVEISNYVTSPPPETAPDLADFHQRQGHAPRFAGKDGKLRLGYAGMGRYEFFRSRGLHRPSRRRNLGAHEEALRIFERRRGLILDQAESPAA
jgi:hypothetical protein